MWFYSCPQVIIQERILTIKIFSVSSVDSNVCHCICIGVERHAKVLASCMFQLQTASTEEDRPGSADHLSLEPYTRLPIVLVAELIAVYPRLRALPQILHCKHSKHLSYPTAGQLRLGSECCFRTLCIGCLSTVIGSRVCPG